MHPVGRMQNDLTRTYPNVREVNSIIPSVGSLESSWNDFFLKSCTLNGY